MNGSVTEFLISVCVFSVVMNFEIKSGQTFWCLCHQAHIDTPKRNGKKRTKLEVLRQVLRCRKCTKTHLRAFTFSKHFRGLYPRTPISEGDGREGGGDRGRGDGEGERTNARERERKRGGEAIGGWNGRETRNQPSFLADRRL